MKKQQECIKCKYKWIPRVEKPRQCPNCKRQIKEEKVEGYKKIKK